MGRESVKRWVHCLVLGQKGLSPCGTGRSGDLPRLRHMAWASRALPSKELRQNGGWCLEGKVQAELWPDVFKVIATAQMGVPQLDPVHTRIPSHSGVFACEL